MNLSSKTTFSNGSITNLPSGDTLAYDCEGNLACVSNTVSGAVSLYWYDQHGRRVAKQENGLLTLYIWDGMDIIATAHADGTIREYYTRGIGIAGDVGSLIAETRFENNAAVSTTYLHSNWRGDVVMATDTSGNVVGEYSYTTFGEQLSSIGNFVPRFTFSSKERDASGLVYHGFRYYSPVLCRWISEDPIREFGGINLYQFCWNNPVNGVDPWGLIRWADAGRSLGGGIGNGLGMIGGGVLAVGSGGLGATLGGVIVFKSGYGLSANFQNLVNAFFDNEPVSSGSFLNDVAELVSPDDCNAQRLATAVDLAIDLVGLRYANTAQVLSRYDYYGNRILEGRGAISGVFTGNADQLLEGLSTIQILDTTVQQTTGY